MSNIEKQKQGFIEHVKSFIDKKDLIYSSPEETMYFLHLKDIITKYEQEPSQELFYAIEKMFEYLG